jgi:uncharacterized protein YceH (UPF0502 family)
MPHDLTAEEVRVLGALVEKGLATPQNYPLTLNALRTACNQSTGRTPVVDYSDRLIEDALTRLRADGWTRIVYSPANRAPKYRHVLDERLVLDDAQTAVLGVLLLRGPQTVGEIKSRTERMHAFGTIAEVDEALRSLSGPYASREEGLVVRLAPRPGQKEARWAHLLSGEPVEVADLTVAFAPTRSGERRDDRVAALEAELAEVRDHLAALRAEFDAFRADLGG